MSQTTTDPLDTTIDIVTPENIEFHYRLAGPFRRLPALMLDYLIRVTIYGLMWFIAILVLTLLVAFLPSLRGMAEFLFGGSIAFMLVFWFVVDWFYGGFFESHWNGQTPGKRMLGIRVVTINGQPINGLQAVLRNVLRYADLCPLMSLRMFSPLFGDELDGGFPDVYMIPTLLVGLISMLVTRRFQRLGDLVCGTMVIVEERKWLVGVARLEDPRAAQLASYLPADFVVSRPMARALAMYVDRRRFFTIERRREVARHLAQPLIRQFGLLPDTSDDLLLCALYYRAFVADKGEEVRPASLPAPALPLYPPGAAAHPGYPSYPGYPVYPQPPSAGMLPTGAAPGFYPVTPPVSPVPYPPRPRP